MADWIQQLRTQATIRRSIIVHGNVNDMHWNKLRRECETIPSVLYNQLLDMGYSEVIVWDRNDGGRSIKDPGKYHQVYEKTVSDDSSSTAEGTDTGEQYNLGEDLSENSAIQTNLSKDPEDFFSMVLKRISSDNNEAIAFVIDWSDSLFGNASSLCEKERVWLLILGKAIRDASSAVSIKQLDKLQDILILISNKLASIPSQFYQNNASITELHIPLPNRQKRSEFIATNIDSWRFRVPMQTGTRDYEEFLDALDQMTIRDLYQLMRLSRLHSSEPVTPKKLLTLYKYGESSSPWEDLSRSRLMELEETLKSSVMGQDQAIEKVNSVVIRAFSGLSGLQHSTKQQTPKGTLFFVGPTGVGKTELAKALARFLFGDEEACIRFDMSEFNHEQSDQRLVGAPPGYVGYEEGGQLTNAIKNRPFSVILFDEIEKAHGKILDKFLQILEDGRLTDGKGVTVSFSEAIIIFTSNIGAADIKPALSDEAVHKEFKNKVKDHFISRLKRPELLNRIGDNIVPFNFLKDQTVLHKIINAKLKPIRTRLKEKYRIVDLILDNEDNVLEALSMGFDSSTGGRGVLNQLSAKLIDPLAEFLFLEGDADSFSGKIIKASRIGKTSILKFEFE